ncbi:MAG TPA: CHAT domain-containing protein, partial [bacterium]|nr:CHAT domain-containing protein [bacterium]
SPAYRERERELERRLAGLADDDLAGLAAIEQEMSLLERDLRRDDPRLAEVRYPNPASLADVQGALPANAVLLEYLVGEDASWLWIVTPTGFRRERLPDGRRLAESVRELRAVTSDYNVLGADPAYLIPPARALGRALLDPARPELASARRVIVAPDGPLHLVPFAALLVEDSSARHYRDLPHAVRRWDLSRVPSGTSLTRNVAAGPAPGAALLLGDPVLDDAPEASLRFLAAAGTTPPPLPFAARELDAVAARIPSARRLSGADATRAALAAILAEPAPPALVHVATHGVLNGRRPRLSGLLLTPGEGDDDGFLSLGEVFALRMPCDLVVLSACATSLGENLAGEGVVGLARAFRFAGARNVVSSLWPVSGAATAALMDRFYAEWQAAPGPDRAPRALAAAQRAWLRDATTVPGLEGVDVAHPCFWAAFVLTR